MKRNERTDRRADSISLRTWPSVRFSAEFAARLRAMDITGFVEQALIDASDKVCVPGTKLTWRDFDAPSEGETWIRMALEKRIPMKGDEELKRSFVLTHEAFFLDKKGNPDARKIGVLWKLIDFYLDDWTRGRDIDAWATAERMATHLKQANIEPPPYGNKAK
jgi:hypothetical protein